MVGNTTGHAVRRACPSTEGASLGSLLFVETEEWRSMACGPAVVGTLSGLETTRTFRTAQQHWPIRRRNTTRCGSIGSIFQACCSTKVATCRCYRIRSRLSFSFLSRVLIFLEQSRRHQAACILRQYHRTCATLLSPRATCYISGQLSPTGTCGLV